MARSAALRMRTTSAFALRAAGLAAAWWALSGGDPASFAFGLPAALLAAAVSLRLRPPGGPAVRAGPLLAFLPFFIAQSLRGGWDVARRVYDPAMPLAPALFHYDVAAMPHAERMAFILMINLLPGTLAARLDGDDLCIHALDRRMPIADSLRRLDARLAPIFSRPPRAD